MTIENIINLVHSVFDKIVGPNNITIIQKQDGLIYIGIQRPTPPLCIYLELYISTSDKNKNNIHIHTLDNCKEQKKGRELLRLVEELGHLIGSSQITLVDASKIKLDNESISLKTLYNLTTGQSWYNSLGYVCINNPYGSHAEIFESNKNKIKNSNVKDFIDEIKNQMHDRDTENLIDEIFGEITEKYQSELNPEMSIQDYFTVVQKIIRQNTSSHIYLLIKLLYYIEISDIITTSISDCLLVKDIIYKGGINLKQRKKRTKKKMIRVNSGKNKKKYNKNHKKYSKHRLQKTKKIYIH